MFSIAFLSEVLTPLTNNKSHSFIVHSPYGLLRKVLPRILDHHFSVTFLTQANSLAITQVISKLFCSQVSPQQPGHGATSSQQVVLLLLRVSKLRRYGVLQEM